MFYVHLKSLQEIFIAMSAEPLWISNSPYFMSPGTRNRMIVGTGDTSLER
jgi:hypothetical protein